MPVALRYGCCLCRLPHLPLPADVDAMPLLLSISSFSLMMFFAPLMLLAYTLRRRFFAVLRMRRCFSHISATIATHILPCCRRRHAARMLLICCLILYFLLSALLAVI